MGVLYFLIPSILLSIKRIPLNTMNSAKWFIMTLYILFGTLRIITFVSGIYLIPKLRRKKITELRKYPSYKYLTKIWLALLLISPILCNLMLVLGYIEDNINNKIHDESMTNIESQNETLILFLSIVFELLLSIYFFFATNTFISLKWPNYRQ